MAEGKDEVDLQEEMIVPVRAEKVLEKPENNGL